jgi:hypothetical protein
MLLRMTTRAMDRRRFLTTSVALAATLPSLRSLAQTPETHTAKLTLHPDQPGPTIPHNFVGLSYETQQLSDPNYFSPSNTGLIAQLRALAPHGVLRLGGNTSDYGLWKPTPTSIAPPRAAREYKVGDPPPDLSYAVTPAAVHNLRAFLDATGWSCLYGINLGTNTPELAAAEAAYVAKTLGAKLEYFQIGNEADRFGSTIRDPKLWTVETFLDEWTTFAQAILARVPNAKFGMPDIASNEKWFAAIGDRFAASPLRAHIACLSHHYYIGGPPSDPTMTVERILKTDPKVAKVASVVSETAAKLGTQWRMTEGNTCYRGGKPGVSDVFAASLWAADYMLQLASLGYAGVNLHGGDAQTIATGLGGKLPGDEVVPDNPANHPRPYYTPIAHIGANYIAEPVSFGMRFAGLFAGATMMKSDFDPGSANATAYAAQLEEGGIGYAIINKDLDKDLVLDLDFDSGQMTHISWMFLGNTSRLHADAPQSTHVSVDGQLGGVNHVVKQRDSFIVDPKDSIKQFTIPRTSALFISGGRAL